jgi:hypothetical protein
MYGGTLWTSLALWSAQPSLREQWARANEQSYINDLHAALQNSRNISDQNYNAGKTWMNKANRLEAELERAEALLAQANAIIAEQEARIQKDWHEKKSLEETSLRKGSFNYILTRVAQALLNAADAGKTPRPDYQEFKKYAYRLFDAYQKGFTDLHKVVQVDDEYFELEKSLKR